MKNKKNKDYICKIENLCQIKYNQKYDLVSFFIIALRHIVFNFKNGNKS